MKEQSGFYRAAVLSRDLIHAVPVLTNSFGLPHTGCMTGYSAPTKHLQKFFWIRERGSLPQPLILSVSKLLKFPAVVLRSLPVDLYNHHFLQDLWWKSLVLVSLWACDEKRVDLEPTVWTCQTSKCTLMLCGATDAGWRVAPIPCQL